MVVAILYYGHLTLLFLFATYDGSYYIWTMGIEKLWPVNQLVAPPLKHPLLYGMSDSKWL